MSALSRSRSLRVVAFVRTVRTASGALAVQIVHGSRHGRVLPAASRSAAVPVCG